MDIDNKQILSKVSREITGPVLLDFVLWVLKESQLRQIDTLYFLARDGYVLYKIANYLTQQLRLPITCKYLYCSRQSLRLPTYHLIGEEAYDLLFLGGYHVTPQTMLNRGDLTEERKQAIFRELELSEPFCNSLLGSKALMQFSQRLKTNRNYSKSIMENSQAAYPATIGYLKQEGLLTCQHVAIVDSGWTGSVQRSLRQLLESAGFVGAITGFYFGMYSEPKDPKDGEYLTWYFNKKGALWDKVFFCNNLFECILSAPHGMTLKYEKRGAVFAPVLAAAPSGEHLAQVTIQIDEIMTYIKNNATVEMWQRFNENEARNNTRKRLHRFMARPTRDEATAYGAFMFDDDVMDREPSKLAGTEQRRALSSYLLHNRILRKLGFQVQIRELFWPYGAIAFLPKWKQILYRWNVCMWETLKYSIR